MDKSKILNIVIAVISIIGAFLFIRVLMAGDDVEAVDSAANIIVYYGTFLLIVTALITFVLSMVSLVKNPAALKKTLMGVAVLAVLLIISYVIASDAAVTDSFGNIVKNGEAGSVSKWVGALINFTGILGLIGLVTIGWGFVKSFK